MKIYKSSTKMIRLSLVALVGASLVASCSKGGSSSSPNDSIKQSGDSNQQIQPQLKLTAIPPSTQLKTKVGTEIDGIIILKNEGKEKISNITLEGFEAPLTRVEQKEEDKKNNDADTGKSPDIIKLNEDAKPVENVKADEVTENKFCSDKTVLNPNDTCEVKVKFNPTEIKSDKKVITVNYFGESNISKKETIDINYFGRGEVDLKVTSSLDQLVALPNNSNSAKLKIENTSGSEVSGLSFSELKAPLFLEKGSNSCKETLAANESCELEVKFSPLKPITDTQDLKIEYNNEDLTKPKLTEIQKISYSAIGKAQLKIDLGNDILIANKAKSEIRPITVENIGNGDASAIVIPSVPSPFSIEKNDCYNKVLKQDEKCTFNVKFDPKDIIDKVQKQDIVIKYSDGKNILETKSSLKYMSVDDDVLNLSKYQIMTSSIEVDVACNKKQIYGNRKHSIPIISKFTATDENGKLIIPANEALLAATKIQLRLSNNDVTLPSGTNEILPNKDEYSRCIDSSVEVPSQNVKYFKTGESGAPIVLAAMVQYVDKNGVISKVSTTESGRVRIEALRKENYEGSFLSLTQEGAKGNPGFYSNGYSLIRVSRNVSEAEKWKGLETFKINYVTMTDTYWDEKPTTGRVEVDLVKNKETDIAKFVKNKFSTGRNFATINVFQKKYFSSTDVNYLIDGWGFNLGTFLPNDIGIGVKSVTSGVISHRSAYIHNYTLKLEGYDMYGNDFAFTGNGTDL